MHRALYCIHFVPRALLPSVIFTVPRRLPSLLCCRKIFFLPKAVSWPQCHIVQSDILNPAADRLQTLEKGNRWAKTTATQQPGFFSSDIDFSQKRTIVFITFQKIQFISGVIDDFCDKAAAFPLSATKWDKEAHLAASSTDGIELDAISTFKEGRNNTGEFYFQETELVFFTMSNYCDYFDAPLPTNLHLRIRGVYKKATTTFQVLLFKDIWAF